MNPLRSPGRTAAGVLLLLAVAAAVPHRAGARDEHAKKPFMMKHKTKQLAAVESQPQTNGRWDTQQNFVMPINPVHVALMSTGKVLVVSGSGNDPDSTTPPNVKLKAAVWDPKTQNVRVFDV